MKTRGSLEDEKFNAAQGSAATASRSSVRRAGQKRWLQWSAIALIAVAYLVDLTPGHIFAPDDFAAYTMHAANLAEGRPYTSINYIANPKAL